MNDDLYLSSKYPDLLAENADPDTLRLVRHLDIIATAGAPPQYVVSSIEAAIQERSTRASMPARGVEQPVSSYSELGAGPKWWKGPRRPLALRHLWLPATGLAVAIVLLAVMFRADSGGRGVPNPQVTLSQPSATALPTADSGPYVGVEHLEAAGMGKQVNLRHTENGYTMLVSWVYADGNQVIVRYDITPSRTDDGLRIGAGSPQKLTDERGTIYPSFGSDQVGGRGWVSPWYARFDTSHLAAAPGSLNLRLSIGGLFARLSASDLRKMGTPEVTQLPERRRLAGPFAFDFTVPVMPARVARVGETVTAEGVKVTLEELRVSPSEARAIVRLEPPGEHANLEWRPAKLHLSVGEWYEGLGIVQGDRRYRAGASSQPLGGGRWSYSWPVVPYDRREEWVVTVTQLIGYAPGLVPEVVLDGDWSFKVILPQAPHK